MTEGRGQEMTHNEKGHSTVTVRFLQVCAFCSPEQFHTAQEFQQCHSGNTDAGTDTEI